MKALIPNILTVIRVVIIIPFIASFYLADPGIIPAVLFAIAGWTDFFDGYLSRKWNVTSPFGIFLDPIADKLLVTAALLMLVAQAWAPLLPCLIILLREVLVSGLREYLAPKNVTMPVTTLAKWKTMLQLVSILILLLGYIELGTLAIWLATVVTVITGYQYVALSAKHIK